MSQVEHLRADWAALGVRLGTSSPAWAALGDDLLARYQAPERHYHDLEHLAELLALLGPAKNALVLAVWFHDAVYDPRAGDNEERSADLAESTLLPLGVPADVSEVARLVRLTKAHTTSADDHDGRLLLDVDLAILGADEARYDRYAADVRREYAWVPDEEYRAGRLAVLERFLARPRLFHTATCASRETAARRNLTREIATLRGGKPDDLAGG